MPTHFFSNCNFIDKITDAYIVNFHDEENAVNNLKNFCREHFRNFLSLICLLKCLVAVGEEQKKHILNIWNVNECIVP